MTRLLAPHLHDDLPLAFLPLVEGLARFQIDVLRARAGPADLEALRADMERLLDDGRRLAAGTDPVTETELLPAFAAGALRATQLSRTVEGAPLSFGGTARAETKTLYRFRPDLEPEDAPRVRAALDRMAAPLFAVAARVADAEATLEVRRSVCAALYAAHPVHDAEDAARLFGRLYPDSPLRAGEAFVLPTATALVFVVPFEGDRLLEPAAPLAGREAEISRFLGQLSRFQQRYFAHFPMFGCFRGEDADPALLEELSERTGLSTGRVAELLTTQVATLPAAHLEQYLVHDAWGHGWQAALFHFDEAYRAAADFERLPPLGQRFGEDSLLDLAVLATTDPAGAEARFGRYLDACVAPRLHLALGGLVAEVLADVIEAKLCLTVPDLELPSSSFFPDRPTKLDLTLADLPYYIEAATAAFFRLGTEEGETALAEELNREAALSASGAEAAAVLSRLARDQLAGRYKSRPQAGAQDGRLAVNAAGRLALNFVALQSALDPAFERAVELGLSDVLLFSLASFLEKNWVERFWLLDEAATGFVPLLERLAEQLR